MPLNRVHTSPPISKPSVPNAHAIASATPSATVMKPTKTTGPSEQPYNKIISTYVDECSEVIKHSPTVKRGKADLVCYFIGGILSAPAALYSGFVSFTSVTVRDAYHYMIKVLHRREAGSYFAPIVLALLVVAFLILGILIAAAYIVDLPFAVLRKGTNVLGEKLTHEKSDPNGEFVRVDHWPPFSENLATEKKNPSVHSRE